MNPTDKETCISNLDALIVHLRCLHREVSSEWGRLLGESGRTMPNLRAVQVSDAVIDSDLTGLVKDYDLFLDGQGLIDDDILSERYSPVARLTVDAKRDGTTTILEKR